MSIEEFSNTVLISPDILVKNYFSYYDIEKIYKKADGNIDFAIILLHDELDNKAHIQIVKCFVIWVWIVLLFVYMICCFTL